MVAVVVRVSQRTGDATPLPIRKFEIDAGRNYDGFEDFAFMSQAMTEHLVCPFSGGFALSTPAVLDNSVPFWIS